MLRLLLPLQELELVGADIGAQMAWTYYFLKDEFDKVSPLINERIIEEVNRNLINPYFARDDYWWMGFGGQQVNNWNPWINYNVLQALMLIEKDPERVRQGVWKLMKSTDFFFSMYHEDGACDEGRYSRSTRASPWSIGIYTGVVQLSMTRTFSATEANGSISFSNAMRIFSRSRSSLPYKSR